MLIGQRVDGRYKILEQIGGGGMSNVYLAHDMILNRDVAIKVMRYNFSNEEELHRRFQREALSATSLTHPNIVNIYDVGEDGDIHYIAMEYIKGQTLKHYIQEFAPLSPSRSVHIMKQLTSALAHAHDHGIIHRDIKPQNILMDLTGDVKITDFGIATSISATSYTQTNSVIGTVHYLSPEQASGSLATEKSDIYALGIVLYELLTGELPFSGETAVAIALKHLQTATPSVRGFDATIPQSVENIVLKATAKDVNHRYQTVQEMEHDLMTALSPNRINEPTFTLPVDDGATKLMPVIKDESPIPSLAATKKMEPIKESPVPNHKMPMPKKSKKKVWILAGLSAILIAMLLFALFFMKPQKIEIPDVENQTVEDATIILEEAGFVIRKVDERNSEDFDEGKVIATDPKSGLLRMKGAEITLIVSLGAESDIMEDYEGKSIDQVRTLLGRLDVDYQIEEEYADEPAGTIIAQEPKAGEEIVVKDTVIRLTISKGKQDEEVDDLTNYSKSALDSYAKRMGFKIKVVKEEHHSTIAQGNVIEQTPREGQKLAVGGTLEVVLSKGPAAKQVKYYSESVQIDYVAEEPEQPQELTDVEGEEGEEQEVAEPVQPVEPVAQVVRIYIQDKNNTMLQPHKEMKITESTFYRVALTIEEGSVGAYRIERDGYVIAEKKISYEDLE